MIQCEIHVYVINILFGYRLQKKFMKRRQKIRNALIKDIIKDIIEFMLENRQKIIILKICLLLCSNINYSYTIYIIYL